MATITLTSTWIHDATDPSDLTSYVQLIQSGGSSKIAAPGEIRTYANGRVRAIFRTGARRTFDCSFNLVAPADRLTLESWVEDHTRLLYREPWGRLAWGHITDLSDTEYPATDYASVSFTFLAITYEPEFEVP